MTSYQKFTGSFIMAVTLHFSILALFGMSFFAETESETVKQKALPEIIHASMLDDEKIQQEAERLQVDEQNKKRVQQEKQTTLQNKLKQEQQRLEAVKQERLKEEIKTKEIEKKRKELAQKEQQKREQLNKLKAEEAAQLAKIKAQKEAENLRAEEKRKADEQKRKIAEQKHEAERLAKQKKQQQLEAEQKAIAEKQKAEEAQKAALAKQQAAAAEARIAQENKAIISSTVAIQRKVNNSWIKPISSAKGLRCTISVKLLPSGDVMDATIVRSSGNGIFDRSAENAVRKASPLPVPNDRALFTKKFRTFTFVFKPE